MNKGRSWGKSSHIGRTQHFRILACTATKHQPNGIADKLAKEEMDNEQKERKRQKKQEEEKEEKEEREIRQHFLLCDWTKIIALFGEFFANLVDSRTSTKKLTKAEILRKGNESFDPLIKIRSQMKRGFAEAFSEEDEGDH